MPLFSSAITVAIANGTALLLLVMAHLMKPFSEGLLPSLSPLLISTLILLPSSLEGTLLLVTLLVSLPTEVNLLVP